MASPPLWRCSVPRIFLSGNWPHSIGAIILWDRILPIFTVSLILNFVAAIGLLVREYYTTVEPRMRPQLKFWLFGMGVALPPGLTNLLPAYGIRFYPLGNLASVLWAGIVGYAIVRHRLMDIDVVVAKGLAYIGVSVIVIGPIGCIFLFLQDWAFGGVHYDFSAAVMVLFFAVGVLFPRLQIVTEKRLGRSLFRTRYEARAALDALAGEVVRVLDRQRLLGSSASGSVTRSRSTEWLYTYLMASPVHLPSSMLSVLSRLWESWIVIAG